MLRARLGLSGVVLAAALSLVRCEGSRSSEAGPTSPDGGATVVVGQNGLPRFVAEGAVAPHENEVTVSQGARVTWRFATSGFNVVSGGGSPDAGCVPDGLFCSPADQNCTGAVPPQVAGSFYQHTFASQGDYAYFSNPGCLQGMTGVVHVTALPPDGGMDGGADGGP